MKIMLLISVNVVALCAARAYDVRLLGENAIKWMYFNPNQTKLTKKEYASFRLETECLLSDISVTMNGKVVLGNGEPKTTPAIGKQHALKENERRFLLVYLASTKSCDLK